jgi:hypothetical protein
MSQLAIIVDIPEVASLSAGNFIDIANDATRQVRNQFPAEAPADIRGKGTFSTTTTDADPGAGALRLNNADQRAATKLYVPDDLTASTDWAAATARLGAVPGTIKGYVRLQIAATPENYIVFEVNSVTDASGYTKLNGTVKSYSRLSTGTSPTVIFANSAALQVTVVLSNTTRRSATLDSTVVGAQLSALTDAEIAADVAAGVLTAIAAVETLTVAGAAAGNVTVTGVAVGDVIVKVFKVVEANPPTSVDLTAEFTVTATNTINNVGGTSSSGESLVVVWYTPVA